MADSVEQLLIKVKLTGGAATRAELVETGAGVKALGTEAKVTGDKMAFASEKAFLFGESSYALKRYAFFAVTAIGLTGAGILKMGYDFDEARTRGVGALTSLVGGTQAARVEVTKLVALTHDSGLELSGLVTGEQNLLRFGFTAKAALQYLSAFANFAGKNGLGQGGVESFSSIFQNVQDTGWFTSRNLKALEGLGVPGTGALGKELGLSPAEWYQFTHGGGQIAAGSALPAIAAYLQQVAASQPKSLGQNFAIIRSYLAQIFGTVGTPIFGWLDKEGEQLTKKGGFLDRIAAAGSKGGAGGILNALDPSGTLLNAWKSLGNALSIVGWELSTLWKVAAPFVALFAAIASAILSVTAHSTLLKAILVPLTGIYLVHFVGELVEVAKAMKAWAIATALADTATTLWAASMWILDAALWANPIGLIVIAVVAAGVAFYLLYTRVKGFRDFVNAYWPELVAVVAPFALPLILIATHIQTIWDLLKSLYSWVSGHVFKVAFSFPGSGLLGDLEHPLRTVEHAVGHPLETAKTALKVSPIGAAGEGYKHLAHAIADAVSKRPIHVNVDHEKIAEATFKGKHLAEARK